MLELAKDLKDSTNCRRARGLPQFPLSGSWTLILVAGQAGMTNSSRYSGLEMVTLLLYSDQPTPKGASLRQRVRRDFPRAIGSNRCTLVKSSKRARPVPVTRCPCAKVKLLV
jgi:hypothetical protein